MISMSGIGIVKDDMEAWTWMGTVETEGSAWLITIIE
jgi:hypothetical protein